MKNFKFIDLFAGIGGIRLGFEEIGGECVFSSEWDKYAQDTYEANFGERPQGDITTINPESIPNHDILLGGFPCQAFSHAGNKLGFEDTRGTLFYEFARAVKEIKPKIFLAENVEAILRNQDGKTIEVIMNVLGSFGYDVRYEILNAVDYGVAQKRKRVFFIGTKKGIKFQYPTKNKNQITLGDALKNVPKSIGSKASS